MAGPRKLQEHNYQGATARADRAFWPSRLSLVLFLPLEKATHRDLRASENMTGAQK